jgi:hypothetical protein
MLDGTLLISTWSSRLRRETDKQRRANLPPHFLKFQASSFMNHCHNEDDR